VCHDIQHNDTQHKGVGPMSYTQPKEVGPMSDTQHKGPMCDTQHK
jgi:hypothetical protein